MFFQLLVGGIELGCVYALIALGFSLIYASSGLTTFAQGEMFMLGAFMIYTFFMMARLPFAISMLCTIVFMGFFGAAIEGGLISPLMKRGASGMNIVLATIAISTIMSNAAMLIWGAGSFNFPSIFGSKPIHIGSVYVTGQQIAIVVVSLLCMLLVHFFMTKTKLGIAMRAAAMDQTAASAVGINVPMTYALTWALACILAAVGGIMLAPIYNVYAKMGALVSSKGFAAAVVGGYGNMYGAMVGGLLLGIIETMSAGYISSSIKDIVCYVVLIAVMFIKPSGIFNGKVVN